MIDKSLEVAESFDWITPAVAFIKDIAHGPSHTFLIPYDACPISGRDIEILLKKHGVIHWGVMIVDGTLMVTVKKSDAAHAQYVLDSNEVPIGNRLPTHKAKKPSSRRRRRTDHPGSPFSVFRIFE